MLSNVKKLVGGTLAALVAAALALALAVVPAEASYVYRRDLRRGHILV